MPSYSPADDRLYSFFFWLEIQRPLAAKGLAFYQVILYSESFLLLSESMPQNENGK